MQLPSTQQKISAQEVSVSLHTGHTDSVYDAHLEALSEWLTQVLCDLVHTYTAHCPHSQSSNERVGVLTVLGEGVDSKNGQVRLGLGIVHQVEVD